MTDQKLKIAIKKYQIRTFCMDFSTAVFKLNLQIFTVKKHTI